MRLKTLLILNSVVGAGSALTAILFGEKVLSMYGVDSNPAASLMGQYSALGTIAMALVAWFARNVEEGKRKAPTTFLVFEKRGAIIRTIMLMTSGLLNLNRFSLDLKAL